jgi:hemerythrin-like domain-containing protein
MTESHAAPQPDTTDMLAVHAVFRDTLDAAPALIDAASDGDAAHAALVANYYDNVLHFLEVHHEAEEQLVFPLLRERCPDDGAVIDQMEADHAEMLVLLERAQSAVTAWGDGEGDGAGGARDALESLQVQLVGHLDREEDSLLPLCGPNLSVEEWGAIPGHTMASYRGDKIWLIMGLIRERMNDEQRAAMLEHMPPPARDMWTGFGEQAFNELSAEVAVEVAPRGRG